MKFGKNLDGNIVVIAKRPSIVLPSIKIEALIAIIDITTGKSPYIWSDGNFSEIYGSKIKNSTLIRRYQKSLTK